MVMGNIIFIFYKANKDTGDALIALEKQLVNAMLTVGANFAK